MGGRYDSVRKEKLWISLNEYEYQMLNKKAEMCHISRVEYIRQLICGICPTEAPDSRFYEMYERVNSTLNEIERLNSEALAESYMSESDVNRLESAIISVRDNLLDMKKLVLEAKPYSNAYFEHIIGAERGD